MARLRPAHRAVMLLILVAAIGCSLTPRPAARGLPGEFDVRTFGAKGDGEAIDTAAINAAIRSAAAAGGGTVRFPAGDYVSFSIHLESNVCLYLDQGATLIAATPTKELTYDPPEPNPAEAFQDFGHSHWHNSLICGEHVENVSILGPGRIWGRGLDHNDHVPEGHGNKSVALKFCRNVVIRDVTIFHGGHFGILATGVDNLTLDNLKIDTNRDGFDVDCCRNVRISNCSVNSPGDDGICLKSSFALGEARATENVTITNCQVSGYEEGSFLDGTFHRWGRNPTGRIKLGTESNGGFKNIAISNCVFDYCRGLALETVDGGPMEDVTVVNLAMRDVVNAPVFIRLGNRARGPAGTPVADVRRISISDVVIDNADTANASIISGIPGYDIEDVKLSNIRVVSKGGGALTMADTQPLERETGYPEPSSFGYLPAYGFFVRHVKGIEFSGVDLSCVREDPRPAFILFDVAGAGFRDVNAQHAPGTPVFSVEEADDLSITGCRGVQDVRREHVMGEKF